MNTNRSGLAFHEPPQLIPPPSAGHVGRLLPRRRRRREEARSLGAGVRRSAPSGGTDVVAIAGMLTESYVLKQPTLVTASAGTIDTLVPWPMLSTAGSARPRTVVDHAIILSSLVHSAIGHELGQLVPWRNTPSPHPRIPLALRFSVATRDACGTPPGPAAIAEPGPTCTMEPPFASKAPPTDTLALLSAAAGPSEMR